MSEEDRITLDFVDETNNKILLNKVYRSLVQTFQAYVFQKNVDTSDFGNITGEQFLDFCNVYNPNIPIQQSNTTATPSTTTSFTRSAANEFCKYMKQDKLNILSSKQKSNGIHGNNPQLLQHVTMDVKIFLIQSKHQEVGMKLKYLKRKRNLFILFLKRCCRQTWESIL